MFLDSRKSKFIGTFRSIKLFKIGLMIIQAHKNNQNLSFDFTYIIMYLNKISPNFVNFPTAIS